MKDKKSVVPKTFRNIVVTRPKTISLIVDTVETLEKKYRTPYTGQCFHCGFTCEDLPFCYPYPDNYNPRTFKITPKPNRFLCSGACLFASIVAEPGADVNARLEWARAMFGRVYKHPSPHLIPLAKDKEEFVTFNGSITKKQHRKLTGILPRNYPEPHSFEPIIAVIKHMVKDLEKGQEKQREYDYATKLVSDQKEKKKAATDKKSGKKPQHTAKNKNEASNSSSSFSSSSCHSTSSSVSPTLALKSHILTIHPTSTRKEVVEQVMQAGDTAGKDFWKLSQVLKTDPQKTKEITDMIVKNLDEDDRKFVKQQPPCAINPTKPLDVMDVDVMDDDVDEEPEVEIDPALEDFEEMDEY
jgi:hypothetical protein